MKISLLALLTILSYVASGQVPTTHTLRVQGDTVRWEFNATNSTEVIRFSKMDSVDNYNSPQKYEGKLCSWVFATGNQRITVGHNDGKLVAQRIALTDGITTKYIQVNFFGDLSAHFPESYQRRFRGTVTYEIPEAYELANVAMALTEAGQADANMIQKEGNYFSRVKQYFAAFVKHPLILRLNERLKSDGGNFYYGVRENAYAMELSKDNFPVNRGVYKAIWPRLNDMAQYPDQWADFVRKSGFRRFYSNNQTFYKDDIADVTRLLPVKRMQFWLEAQFPGIRYDGMRVVFSPLINGSHSAQKFTDQGYRESLMFICDAKGFNRSQYTEPQIEGIYSGVVFTEIDHNFVNPVSDKHLQAINEVFSNRDKWTKKGDTDHYGGAYEVFNEYMTHAVHVLYIKDQYPPDVYQLVRQRRVRLNGEQRGFYRFESFLNELQRLYDSRKPGQTVSDLFPAILKWAEDV
ncbi:hypothetical protein GCM10027592_34380 [Spirosoma flavus]